MTDDPFDDEADEARAEAAHERRVARQARKCQCGGDMPGTCPGPENCPMCDPIDDEEESEE